MELDALDGEVSVSDRTPITSPSEVRDVTSSASGTLVAASE